MSTTGPGCFSSPELCAEWLQFDDRKMACSITPKFFNGYSRNELKLAKAWAGADTFQRFANITSA
eukprot:1738986-Karenia_brevis.AAC.1